MAHTFRINIFNNYIYKLMFIKIFTVIGQTQVGIPFGNQGKTSSWNDFFNRKQQQSEYEGTVPLSIAVLEYQRVPWCSTIDGW